ncbi:alpha-N-arabinofuranosidase, partial [Thermococcus sp. M36]|nr:alpha-N-arabinofuranosidase [Thermococcus sp. M36]
MLSFLQFFFTSCLLAQNTAQLVVNGYNPQTTISRHIYGHFSEHLGRCIYDGFWVSD